MNDSFLIVCAVAVEMKNPANPAEKFSVSAAQRNEMLMAPAWIKDTLEFKLLLQDGSLQCATPMNKAQLENEPTLGINAEGKAEKAAEPAEKAPEAAEEKPAKKTRGKKAAEAE